LSEQSMEIFESEQRRRDAREILGKALLTLSTTDRMILCLCYFQGCTTKETALELGLSQANVKVRAHRAKKQIKELILSHQLQGVERYGK